MFGFIRFIFLFVAFGLLAGFIWFVQGIDTAPPKTVKSHDAIVVLTGGSGRIQSGIMLLANGKGNHLYISGVDDKVDRDEFLNAFPVARLLEACCITLGYEAKNTKGNAEEVAAWLKTKRYNNIILVTANYHMKRSTLVFENVLPTVTITPYPIATNGLDLNNWLKNKDTLTLLLKEYIKLLWALVEDASGFSTPF